MVVEILTSALALTMAHPTHEFYARDAEGEEVDALDPAAVCWCSLGAVRKVVEQGNGDLHERAVTVERSERFLHAAALDMGFRGVVNLNDRAPARVPEMFARAIKEASRE